MNFEYNGLGMVFLISDNFNARIFTRDFYACNKDVVKRIKENFISNEEQIEEKELFDKNLINLTNILSDKISDISLEISNKMLAEKPIYEFFNEYYKTFEKDYGETADIQVANEHDNVKEKPYIMIEKTSEGCYNITYENEDGHYYVKILDTYFSKYSIYGDVKMSDIKNMAEVVKNVDMSEKYDNSGIIKNCEISPSYFVENVITMEKSDDNYKTSISVLSKNYNVSVSTYIKTQVTVDNKDLLPAILEISSNLKPYCHTVDFATEFSKQIVKKLSDIRNGI